MKQYHVKKIEKPVSCTVSVPGSKSITNRALLLATMSNGESVLRNVLFCDDTRSFLECLIKLKYTVCINEHARIVTIKGGVPCNKATINVRSAGTTARFLTAFLSTIPGRYEILASEQMCKRPMKPLFDGLQALGAKIEYTKEKMFLPIRLKGGYLKGGVVNICAEQSSQFLSALLMTGHLYEKGLVINHVGKEIASPYINMTINMIKQFGGNVSKSGQLYTVSPSNKYHSLDYTIEPDVSAACYFFAIAVLTGGTILVKGIHSNSIQGDIYFLEILRKIGAQITYTQEGIYLKGPENGVFNGIDVDLNLCSDQTMTLAALAVYAKTPTTIRNIGHIRFQESDRISAIVTELRKMGIKCTETNNSITIFPGQPQSTIINTYNDHRMAMAFSLIGLRTEGIVIDNPSCVSKTFENYFDLLDTIVNE